MAPRKGFAVADDGTITIPLEDLWRRVRRWARRHGHTYQASYGVVGVAAT